jgi:hypothetical protein
LNLDRTFEMNVGNGMLALRDLMRPVGEQNSMQPACPICSRPFRLTRITPGTDGLADLRTYGCSGCGVWLTEPDEQRAPKNGARRA